MALHYLGGGAGGYFAAAIGVQYRFAGGFDGFAKALVADFFGSDSRWRSIRWLARVDPATFSVRGVPVGRSPSTVAKRSAWCVSVLKRP